MTGTIEHPTPAAGVICFRGDDVLLIRRAKQPLIGQWTLPGGRIRWGESPAIAAMRELAEETGVHADLIGLVDVVDAIFHIDEGPRRHSQHFILIDYAARWRGGEARGADDASEARFFSPVEIETLGLWDVTLGVIAAARRLASTVP